MEKDPDLQQLGYNNYMEVCDTLTRQISRFKLRTWRPYLKPEIQFLDLGCGGKILWPIVFKACKANIICFDKDKDMHSSIHAFFKKNRNSVNFTFRQQDFNWNTKLPFEDKQIDLCVADFLFSELASDFHRDFLLMEMKRVSKNSVIMNLDTSNFRNYHSSNQHEMAICRFLSEIDQMTGYDKTLDYFERRKETFSLQVRYHNIPGNEVNATHAKMIAHLLSGEIQQREVFEFIGQKELVKKLPSERLQVVSF